MNPKILLLFAYSPDYGILDLWIFILQALWITKTMGCKQLELNNYFTLQISKTVVGFTLIDFNSNKGFSLYKQKIVAISTVLSKAYDYKKSVEVNTKKQL